MGGTHSAARIILGNRAGPASEWGFVVARYDRSIVSCGGKFEELKLSRG